MKTKLLMGLVVLMAALSSCSYEKVGAKTEVPSEVMSYVMNADSTNLQPMYVYDVGKDCRYYFNEDKVLFDVRTLDTSLLNINLIVLFWAIGGAFLVGIMAGIKGSK